MTCTLHWSDGPLRTSAAWTANWSGSSSSCWKMQASCRRGRKSGHRSQKREGSEEQQPEKIGSHRNFFHLPFCFSRKLVISHPQSAKGSFGKASKGGIAHLARALAWHARGHRFDSDYLHEKKAVTAKWRLSSFMGIAEGCPNKPPQHYTSGR